MFIAFIAVALELAAMALGAILILSCCYRECFRKNCLCEKGANQCKDKREGVEVSYVGHHTEILKSEHQKPVHSNCHGFLKFIGYFTLILSFIALICTITAFSCFLKDVKNCEKDINGSAQQYNNNLEKLRKYNGDFRAVPRAVDDHGEVPKVNLEE